MPEPGAALPQAPSCPARPWGCPATCPARRHPLPGTGLCRSAPARAHRAASVWPHGAAPLYFHWAPPVHLHGAAPARPQGAAPFEPHGHATVHLRGAAPTWPHGAASVWPHGAAPFHFRQAPPARLCGAAPFQLHGAASVCYRVRPHVPLRSLVRVRVHPWQLRSKALGPHSGPQQPQLDLHLHPGGGEGGLPGGVPPQAPPTPPSAPRHWARSACMSSQRCSVTAWAARMLRMSSRMSSPVPVAMAGGLPGGGSTSTGLCTLTLPSPGTRSCSVPSGSSCGGSWPRAGPGSPASPSTALGDRGGPEPVSAASSAIAPGQGSGKEQREPREEELLLSREGQEGRGGRGARRDRRFLLDTSTLALQRTRGKRPRCSPAPPAGPPGSTPSSAGGHGCPARAGAGHGLRVWGRIWGSPPAITASPASPLASLLPPPVEKLPREDTQ